MPRRDSKWWGWGDPATSPELDAAALAMLRERIGELTPTPRAAELEEFELPPAEPLPAGLLDAVGAESAFTSIEDRLRHATGRGYADLARLRSGRLDAAPDAVRPPGLRRGGAARARGLRRGGGRRRPLRRRHERGRRGGAASAARTAA